MTLRGVLYWALVMVLIGFGIVTGFTIGIPFLLMGVTLMAVAPLRDRPAAFFRASLVT